MSTKRIDDNLDLELSRPICQTDDRPRGLSVRLLVWLTRSLHSQPQEG